MSEAKSGGEDPRHSGHRPTIDKAKADRDVIRIEGHTYGEELTLAQRAFYRFVWVVIQVISRTYFRARIFGTHNIPKKGAFVIAPTHRSNLDTPLLAAITSRRLRYMGKESLWKSKVGAWVLTTAGGFPVERATADREALRACIDVIDRGEPLVMFPEGTRQFGPEIKELFDGPVYVAARTRVPILPVGIGGTEHALGKGMKIPRPSRITVVIGEPIPPPELGSGGRVRRSSIKAGTENLGETLQVLFDESQQLAGTPNIRGDR